MSEQQTEATPRSHGHTYHDQAEPAWKRINALFAMHGLRPPPSPLRDELVCHLVAHDRNPYRIDQ